MIEGTLIAESLRPGTELGGMRLAVMELSRVAAGDVSAGQPELWTLIEFEAGEAAAERLATLLADALDDKPAWYADFRTPHETWVVYHGRIFRYPRGDAAGREEAAAYGRSVGIPADQLDWPV
jgi:hypothetical protein